MVNFGEVRRVQLAKSTLLTSTLVPWDLLRSSPMIRREWGAESNRKLPHLFILSEIAILVPEFAVEDMPLDRTATLIPAFAVKDLPLGRTF